MKKQPSRTVTVKSGRGGFSMAGVIMHDGLKLTQNGVTGVLCKNGENKHGGGHGEGTWYSAKWAIVSEGVIYELKTGDAEVLLG